MMYKFQLGGIAQFVDANVNQTKSKLAQKNNIIEQFVQKRQTNKPKSSPTSYVTPKRFYTSAYRDRVRELGFTSADNVKDMQRRLGVVADGVWGPDTEKAYLASQAPLEGNIQTPIVETQASQSIEPQIIQPKEILTPIQIQQPTSEYFNTIKNQLRQQGFGRKTTRQMMKNPNFWKNYLQK